MTDIMTTKRIIDLTQKDLLDNNVWEHWSDSLIEYVRPSNNLSLSETSVNGHIVLTTFLLNNKTSLFGFCSPQDPSGLDYIQPVALTSNGQVHFYKETPWTLEEEKAALNAIGLQKSDIFPIQFQTKVNCDNKTYNGTILDFNKAELTPHKTKQA